MFRRKMSYISFLAANTLDRWRTSQKVTPMLLKAGYQGVEERYKCIDVKPFLIFVDTRLYTS